jgi:hypothetical protein
VSAVDFCKRHWVALALSAWAAIAVARTLPWYIKSVVTTIKVIMGGHAV